MNCAHAVKVLECMRNCCETKLGDFTEGCSAGCESLGKDLTKVIHTFFHENTLGSTDCGHLGPLKCR